MGLTDKHIGWAHYHGEGEHRALDTCDQDAPGAFKIFRAERVAMKTFETKERVDGMMGCRKKPIMVHAMQMPEEFRVNTLEGNYKQGKPGDYLMRGIEGELYICDREIFEKTYDWVSA